MPDMQLVKTQRGIRGFGEQHERAWRRFKAWLKRLEAGELFTVSYRQPRNIKFHRKFFVLLNFLFEHWEPGRVRKRLTYKGRAIEKSFECFRKDLTILAGFYVQTFTLDGRMRLEAKSIAFDAMAEDEFERLYKAVIDVGIKQILPRAYTHEELARVLEELERFE